MTNGGTMSTWSCRSQAMPSRAIRRIDVDGTKSASIRNTCRHVWAQHPAGSKACMVAKAQGHTNLSSLNQLQHSIPHDVGRVCADIDKLESQGGQGLGAG
jgi:hypothetical protein